MFFVLLKQNVGQGNEAKSGQIASQLYFGFI